MKLDKKCILVQRTCSIQPVMKEVNHSFTNLMFLDQERQKF